MKITEETIRRGVEGPKVVATPPTAHINVIKDSPRVCFGCYTLYYIYINAFPLLWAAIYTFFYPGFFLDF